jgi:hypothetical protein
MKESNHSQPDNKKKIPPTTGVVAKREMTLVFSLLTLLGFSNVPDKRTAMQHV